MTLAMALTMALTTACTAPERQADRTANPLTDPTRQPEYLAGIDRLAALNTEARAHFAAGRRSQAAALVTEGKDIAKELLEVSRPNLAAMEAVADRDEIYADLLFANRHFAHARQMHQRNVARWKHWLPQTDETRRRLGLAEAAIQRCDQALAAER
ncbi:MAG: hypothetical protein R6W76_20095 [Caldilinea sp.]